MDYAITRSNAREKQARSVQSRHRNNIVRLISKRLGELLAIAGESTTGPDIARAVADNPALILRAIQSGDDALCYRIWHDCYEFVHGRAAQTHLVAAQVEVHMSESTASRVRELAARFTPQLTQPSSTPVTPAEAKPEDLAGTSSTES